ncbi:MAG: helix-turn-helix transcriptional regulator [Panacagrimonas sp.]
MTTRERFIRRPEVRHVTGLTDSALDRLIRAGQFPKPVRLSPDPISRAVGWPESRVYQWNADRLAAAERVTA